MKLKELSESIDKLKSVKYLTKGEVSSLLDEPLKILKRKRRQIIEEECPGCLCEDPHSGRWEDLSYHCPHHGR